MEEYRKTQRANNLKMNSCRHFSIKTSKTSYQRKMRLIKVFNHIKSNFEDCLKSF